MAEAAEGALRGRRRASIRTRITAGAVVVVAVALASGAAGVVWLLDRVVVSQISAQLESELESIADGLSDGTVTRTWLEERDDDVLIALHATGQTIVNDEDAAELPVSADDPTRVVIDGETYLVVSREIDEEYDDWESSDEGFGRDRATRGSPERSPSTESSSTSAVLVLARSIEDANATVATAGWLLAIAVPVAVVVIGIVVRTVAARALAPVERLRGQVDEIDPSVLDRRVPMTGRGDEIDRLAGTMNRMLDRIEGGYRARQRFVSDASHELRSPLATMRQYAELTRAHPEATAPGELADVVLAEGARMHDIVEGLLLLARLDEQPVRVTTAIDLDDLALAEIHRVRVLGVRVADGRGISPVRIAGDERLIGRALRNLVDNAVRHAHERVVISTRLDGDRALVQVEDDGDGVPETERERVFDRFTRLDEARSRDVGGSGLGLAIVREIAQAHGGTAAVGVSAAGGARFVLTFPAMVDPA